MLQCGSNSEPEQLLLFYMILKDPLYSKNNNCYLHYLTWIDHIWQSNEHFVVVVKVLMSNKTNYDLYIKVAYYMFILPHVTDLYLQRNTELTHFS